MPARCTGRARAATEPPLSVRYSIDAPASECERLVAELHALGTLGIEERETSPRACLWAYFDHALAAVGGLADAPLGIRIDGPEPVPETDWDARWREGLSPRRIGPLWVRPSWCEPAGSPEVVIDPERAFGSGEHASTRLALWLAAEELEHGDRVLDVGTGSGILSIGLLRLGAGSAVGLEIDRVAARQARGNAEHNGVPLRVVCASLDALSGEARFDLVVANLLLHEVLPLVSDLARRADRALVVAGQLEPEGARLDEPLRSVGLERTRRERETQGGDVWIGSVFRHAAPRLERQSSSRSASVSSSE